MYTEQEETKATATAPRIRAGRYRAAAIRAQMAETQEGNSQVAIEFQLLDLENETIAYYGFFTEKTKERTLASLFYCGWDGNDWTTFNGITNNEVQLDIIHDTYKGKTRAKVAWVNRKGMVVEKPMSEAQALSFAERMRGEALAVKQKLGGKTGTPRQSSRGPDEPGELSDSDIPF